MGWLKAKLIITSIRFVDSSIWTLIDEMNIQAYINPFVGVKIISRETKFIALPETKGTKMACPPPPRKNFFSHSLLLVELNKMTWK